MVEVYIFNYWYEFCVLVFLILDICIFLIKNGNELYVWNDGYLDISGDCVIFFGCVCFVFVIKGLII